MNVRTLELRGAVGELYILQVASSQFDMSGQFDTAKL